MRRFSDALGNKMAAFLATMICFWIVTGLVLIPLLFQRPHDLVGWVQYIVQSFFQGVSLPVLAFVAKIQGDRQEKVQNETHDAAMAEVVELKATHQEAHEKMDRILALLEGEKDERGTRCSRCHKRQS